MTSELNNLLPHREPMMLIEEILAIGDNFATCRVRAGQLPGFDYAPSHPVIGLEYMAQTAAVLGGTKHGPRSGAIIAVRDFRFDRSGFHPGEELTVTSELEAETAQTSIFNCRIERSGTIVMAGRITVHTGTK